MCNLNIIIRKKKNQTLTPFFQSVSAHSYARNDDGDGLYFGSNGKIVKSLHKLDYYKYENEIETSNVVFSFQRLATSGKTLDYVQPFRSKEFIFMHNGVVNSFLKKEGSDSFGFFQDFIKKFDESIVDKRDNKIVGVIKEMLEGKVSDWYSMILYDLVEKKLYYWKNESPQIYFFRYNNLLFITTCEENQKFLNMTGKGKLREIIIEDNVIYKINPTKKKIRIIKVGEIEKEEEELSKDDDDEDSKVEERERMGYTEEEQKELDEFIREQNLGDDEDE